MELKVADCIPTGDNPRLINEDSEKFKVLAASVAADGVKEPIKVRPHPDTKNKYDIRDGARRHRAAQQAGLKTIPALVYYNMTEAEAFEMTFIPFFGREDLTPIEEAKAVALYLDRHDGDTQAVADKLGQTPRWVKRRAHVFENIGRCWLKKIDENEDGEFSGWSISHLALLARFDRDTQKRLCEEYDGWGIDTVADLEAWCGDELRLLKNMTWAPDEQLADADGTALPACDDCPKRSDREPLLFDFDDDPDAARCTDAVCFEAKKDAAVRKQIETARARHPNLKLIGTGSKNEYVYHSERRELKEKFPDVTFEQLEPAKKTDPDAVPCLVMTGKSAGKIRYRKPPKKKSASTSSGGSGGGKTLEQKRDELGRKRWAQVLSELVKEVAVCGIDRIRCAAEAGGMLDEAMLVLVWQFGTHRWFHEDQSFETVNRLLDPDSEMMDPNERMVMLRDIWEEGVRPQILAAIEYNGPVTQTPDERIADAAQVGTLLGIDVDALFDKACRDIREPKSWSKQAAQGEPEAA